MYRKQTQETLKKKDYIEKRLHRKKATYYMEKKLYKKRLYRKKTTQKMERDYVKKNYIANYIKRNYIEEGLHDIKREFYGEETI